MRRALYFIFVLILPCLMLTAAAESHLPLAQEQEIEIISEFPIEVDSLEEFIQSYYELLANDNYLKQFSFLSFDKNSISNMKPVEGFFRKLMKLRNGSNDPITIYQIGIHTSGQVTFPALFEVRCSTFLKMESAWIRLS